MIYLKNTYFKYFFSSFFILSIGLILFTYGYHPKFKDWVEEKIIISEVNTEKKVVALTFDDGPHPENTTLVLDNLKKHNAKATFFVLGTNIKKYPTLIKRIVAEGHEIGNHSYSHANFNNLELNLMKEEIVKTNKLIEEFTKQKCIFFRPPGGYLSYALVDISRKENITIAYWSYIQDSKDWQGHSASKIAQHIVKNIKPGQIIILHDGPPNGYETAKSIDILISDLKKDGYEFVTMSELIKFANTE